jgi:hypothetical protein
VYQTVTSLGAAIREASAVSFPAEFVEECVLSGSSEELFLRAWTRGIDSIDSAERRGRFPGLIGSVAEAVVAKVMDCAGFSVFDQLTELGAHGVDLLLLSPAGRVLALEVKGTLRAGSVPRLRRSRLPQMSAAWLDGANAAMLEWGLEAADVYGGIMFVNLAANETRMAVTGDFVDFVPVVRLEELDELYERFESA